VLRVGDRLKELHIRQAMTQGEFAEAAGIAKNTVNGIEHNRSEPRSPTLRNWRAGGARIYLRASLRLALKHHDDRA